MSVTGRSDNSHCKKHRRVICLSKIDAIRSESVDPAQVVAENLFASNLLQNDSVFDENIVIKKKSVAENNKVMHLKAGVKYSKYSKCLKRDNSLGENDKFLLEQCPPHFGKI